SPPEPPDHAGALAVLDHRLRLGLLTYRQSSFEAVCPLCPTGATNRQPEANQHGAVLLRLGVRPRAPQMPSVVGARSLLKLCHSPESRGYAHEYGIVTAIVRLAASRRRD